MYIFASTQMMLMMLSELPLICLSNRGSYIYLFVLYNSTALRSYFALCYAVAALQMMRCCLSYHVYNYLIETATYIFLFHAQLQNTSLQIPSIARTLLSIPCFSTVVHQQVNTNVAQKPLPFWPSLTTYHSYPSFLLLHPHRLICATCYYY